jgi:hypothetical protein
MNAGMPMPALASLMSMPSYDFIPELGDWIKFYTPVNISTVYSLKGNVQHVLTGAE